MIFNGYSGGGCNCDGQRQQMSIYADDAAEIIGAVDAGATTSQMMPTNSQQRSIWVGVGTGLAVWFLTRLLDKYVFGDKL